MSVVPCRHLLERADGAGMSKLRCSHTSDRRRGRRRGAGWTATVVPVATTTALTGLVEVFPVVAEEPEPELLTDTWAGEPAMPPSVLAESTTEFDPGRRLNRWWRRIRCVCRVRT